MCTKGIRSRLHKLLLDQLSVIMPDVNNDLFVEISQLLLCSQNDVSVDNLITCEDKFLVIKLSTERNFVNDIFMSDLHRMSPRPRGEVEGFASSCLTSLVLSCQREQRYCYSTLRVTYIGTGIYLYRSEGLLRTPDWVLTSSRLTAACIMYMYSMLNFSLEMLGSTCRTQRELTWHPLLYFGYCVSMQYESKSKLKVDIAHDADDNICKGSPLWWLSSLLYNLWLDVTQILFQGKNWSGLTKIFSQSLKYWSLCGILVRSISIVGARLAALIANCLTPQRLKSKQWL